jgi:two-component system sensor histidine kinase PilS (NtrC family)
MGLALHVVALLGTRLTHGLRSIQNLQEEILENMAEGLVAVDSQLRILELNREARRIFGIPGGDSCAGLLLADLLRGDELREVLDAFQGTERRRFEFVRKTGGGRGLPVEGKISCLEIGDGHHQCRIGLFTDLSLKREVEDAERRIHKLEELHDMAIAIAHEIRNPLASIRGCVQELGRAAGRSSMEQRLVEIVCRESDRLDRIIEDFMNSSRRGPLSLRPVDMVRVLDETVIQLRNHPGFGTRTIEMESVDGPAVVSGDWQRLKQVFLNLGMNAIEATDQSSGKIRISLRRQEFLALNRRRSGERRMVPGIEVEFADNGPGMTPEVRRMAFTPFFSTKENGHGLGLAIVHRVVHDHMGKVDVESGPEGGTRFKVWFPVQSREGTRLVAEAVKEVAHA